MRYVFQPEAPTEYSEAVKYYAEQKVEVAQAFINAIEDAVYRIVESPNRYIAVEDEVRRCMARRFPYGILYTIYQEYILILAVMHCSRKPGYWKSRKIPSVEELRDE
jgi:toxin ParE1/3/4